MMSVALKGGDSYTHFTEEHIEVEDLISEQ